MKKLFNTKTSTAINPGVISYGGQKKDGSHDHRYNKGDDRTTAQKQGDIKRTTDKYDPSLD
jgi:hypothetical protein